MAIGEFAICATPICGSLPVVAPAATPVRGGFGYGDAERSHRVSRVESVLYPARKKHKRKPGSVQLERAALEVLSMPEFSFLNLETLLPGFETVLARVPENATRLEVAAALMEEAELILREIEDDDQRVFELVLMM